MPTVTVSPRRLPLFGIATAIDAVRGIAERLRARRKHRAITAQLANLTDRLRQDIGLADSSPSAVELKKRFYHSQRPLPREHENRLKLWI